MLAVRGIQKNKLNIFEDIEITCEGNFSSMINSKIKDLVERS